VDYLLEVWAWISAGFVLVWHILLNELNEHPSGALIALYFVARMTGITIQTGQQGVRYRFGRVVRALGPGFHWKVPGLERIRVVPARSQTLDLERQTLSTPNGLVLELDANLVYRVVDPVKALVQIDDYHEGCLTALALSVQQVIWSHGDDAMRDRDLLDGELVASLAPRLEPWGIEIEEAGFTTLSPSDRTLRFTQLGLRLEERRRLLAHFDGAGLSTRRGLALLGSPLQLRERASARYRSHARKHARRRRAAPEPDPFEVLMASLEADG